MYNNQEPSFALAGIHALVTGGAGNIGRAICLKLSSCGALVTILYCSKEHEATALAEEISFKGGRAQAIAGNIQDEQSVKKAFCMAEESFGPLGILVNNAGGFSSSDQQSLCIEEWDWALNVNLRGAFLCTREVIPSMKQQGSGVIVNIASINGLHPGFGATAHYDAAKAGLIGYTRSLAAELGPYGIRVNAAAPGLVTSSRLLQDAPELAEMVKNRTPLRKLTSPEEAADAVVFLAAPASRAITGTVLVVDGGYLLS